MLKIWGRPNSSNVAKVMWAIAELGVPYERVDAGGAFGIVDTPAYRALNPNGQIPTIEDDGFVLWESNAIVRYLAAKHGVGTLWPEDPRVRADADRWMDWTATTLADSIAALRAAYKVADHDRDEARIATALARTAATIEVLDRALRGRAHVAGDALTMGDVALGPLVHRWFVVPLDKPDAPALAGWYGRMNRREAFATHVAAAVR